MSLVAGLAGLTGCDRGDAEGSKKAEASSKPDEAEPDKEVAEAEPATEAPAPKETFMEVDVADDVPDLQAALAAQAKKASDAGLTPHVEFWASWCGPCKELSASMSDDRMKDAFEGVYLIKVNADAWGDKLEGTGMSTASIPAFYELDSEGKATGRSITGGAWAENIPKNMAPPLKKYFAGEKV